MNIPIRYSCGLMRRGNRLRRLDPSDIEVREVVRGVLHSTYDVDLDGTEHGKKDDGVGITEFLLRRNEQSELDVGTRYPTSAPIMQNLKSGYIADS